MRKYTVLMVKHDPIDFRSIFHQLCGFLKKIEHIDIATSKKVGRLRYMAAIF